MAWSRINPGRVSVRCNSCDTSACISGFILMVANPCFFVFLWKEYIWILITLALSVPVAAVLIVMFATWLALAIHAIGRGLTMFKILLRWRIRRSVKECSRHPFLSLGASLLTLCLLSCEMWATMTVWIKSSYVSYFHLNLSIFRISYIFSRFVIISCFEVVCYFVEISTWLKSAGE